MSEHDSNVMGVACSKCGKAPWEQFDNVCPVKVADLDFGQALAAMKAGKRVRRAAETSKEYRVDPHWQNGFEERVIMASVPTFSVWYSHGRPFIHADLLAADWEICE